MHHVPRARTMLAGARILASAGFFSMLAATAIGCARGQAPHEVGPEPAKSIVTQERANRPGASVPMSTDAPSAGGSAAPNTNAGPSHDGSHASGMPASDGKDSGSGTAPASSAAEREADVRASNTFAAKLYSRSRRASGNVLISASSVRQALGIAHLGAHADTARELATTLGLPSDPSKAAALARDENLAWQEARGNAELFVANRMWTDNRFALKDDFVSAATTAFGASAEAVDFTHAPEPARRTINAWVSSKTAEKIPDLLAEGTVDARTRLLLTNAIYFKGRWATPFPTDATKDEPFKSGARTSSVPMMHKTSSYRFAQVGASKILELRYEGSRLAMLLVLPDDVAGLSKIEESLSASAFEGFRAALTSQRVNATIPKFSFKSGGSLGAPLQELGIRAAFSPRADFTGIADPVAGERLRVSQVVHRTWVSVDEHGTEAAAATGVAMSVTSAPMGPIAEFKADHPFLFFVYDHQTGRILFVGRVSDPKA